MTNKSGALSAFLTDFTGPTDDLVPMKQTMNAVSSPGAFQFAKVLDHMSAVLNWLCVQPACPDLQSALTLFSCSISAQVTKS
ncbi:hypothetical protein ABIC08_009167 [Bradyrhizobium sp. RT9b]|uniref:hypothetical protein n=1 Tax=Bradyrhizobium sp. RT9b TaxID=3156385 RepID=UPI003393A1D6